MEGICVLELVHPAAERAASKNSPWNSVFKISNMDLSSDWIVFYGKSLDSFRQTPKKPARMFGTIDHQTKQIFLLGLSNDSDSPVKPGKKSQPFFVKLLTKRNWLLLSWEIVSGRSTFKCSTKRTLRFC